MLIIKHTISDECAIEEVWGEQHYESILNYVDDGKYKNKVTTILCNTKFDSGMNISISVLAGPKPG